MVAKTDDLRSLLEAWDRSRTAALRAARDETVRRKLEERIVSAAERDRVARDRIRFVASGHTPPHPTPLYPTPPLLATTPLLDQHRAGPAGA